MNLSFKALILGLALVAGAGMLGGCTTANPMSSSKRLVDDTNSGQAQDKLDQARSAGQSNDEQFNRQIQDRSRR